MSGRGPWTVDVPGLRLPSPNELGGEHHMVAARRKGRVRRALWVLLRGRVGRDPPGLPLRVHFVRIGAGTCDREDNLPMAFKAARDEVARYLGVDDADARVRWTYAQEKAARGTAGFRIEITTEA